MLAAVVAIAIGAARRPPGTRRGPALGARVTWGGPASLIANRLIRHGMAAPAAPPPATPQTGTLAPITAPAAPVTPAPAGNKKRNDFSGLFQAGEIDGLVGGVHAAADAAVVRLQLLSSPAAYVSGGDARIAVRAAPGLHDAVLWASLVDELPTYLDRDGRWHEVWPPRLGVAATLPAEIAWVRDLYPAARDYLDTYEAHGLLGPRGVYGHAIHLTAREKDRLREAGASLVHCPTSNTFIGSGLFDMSLATQLRVGLATDTGGAVSYSLSGTDASYFNINAIDNNAKALH